jgi:hypothetical protein
VTSDKEGADSVFERELPDAEIVISHPFCISVSEHVVMMILALARS